MREIDGQEYVDNTLTFSSRLFKSGNWNRNIRIRLVQRCFATTAVWKMINVSRHLKFLYNNNSHRADKREKDVTSVSNASIMYLHIN